MSEKSIELNVEEDQSGFHNDSEEVKRVKKFLGKRYEVILADGRTIRGILKCTDKDANMIFYKVDERWPDSTNSRWMGQVMIAKRNVRGMFPLIENVENRIER